MIYMNSVLYDACSAIAPSWGLVGICTSGFHEMESCKHYYCRTQNTVSIQKVKCVPFYLQNLLKL